MNDAHLTVMEFLDWLFPEDKSVGLVEITIKKPGRVANFEAIITEMSVQGITKPAGFVLTLSSSGELSMTHDPDHTKNVETG